MNTNIPKHILFDLDGTISDNSEGIIGGVVHAMEKLSLQIPSREKLTCFIGPPLKDAFIEFCGLSEDDAELAVLFYREYFREQGIFKNEMYEGFPEVLEKLKSYGFKLYIATSKPEEFAKRICTHFGIDGYFEYIGGATFDGKRGKKADVIRYVLDRFSIQYRDAVMVGDRHHDVSGAIACGIPCIGVLYGFGNRDELKSAGAASIAETPNDIVKLICES